MKLHVECSIPGRDGMIARMGKTRRSSDGQKGNLWVIGWILKNPVVFVL